MLKPAPRHDVETGGRPGRRMRSRLLDAAAARFKQSGFAGVSVADIAGDAEAFPSQVTYYFGTKEALFVEAACREMLYAARDAEAASSAANIGDNYLQVMVQSVVGAPGLNLFVEALALAHRREDLRPLVQRTFERLDGESDRALKEHRAREGLPAANTAVPAHRFWVIALGMAARGGATGEPKNRLAAEMLALLRNGDEATR
jgi:AcrR family transcriptional regulator